jgi:hypothetical protein
LVFYFLKCGSHFGQGACPGCKDRRASWGGATTKKQYEEKAAAAGSVGPNPAPSPAPAAGKAAAEKVTAAVNVKSAAEKKEVESTTPRAADSNVSKREGAGYTSAHEELSGEKAEEYFNAAVTEGGRAMNSSRICVVGQGRAGKTALARALSSQPYEDTESTIGVKQNFLEVNKVGLSAGDGGQWNVLGDGNSTVMSAEESLARCAAELMVKSATSAPDRTKVSSSIIELLEDEERPPDSYQSQSPVKNESSSRTPESATE